MASASRSNRGRETKCKSSRQTIRRHRRIAHFLTVADIERSLRFHETVFGGAHSAESGPGYIQIANTWLLVNLGAVRLPTNHR